MYSAPLRNATPVWIYVNTGNQKMMWCRAKKGYALDRQYEALKNRVLDIIQALPELDSVVPCMFREDHMNQLGALQCPECNPNDFVHR